jgi:tetratricopeptide (TPR) repeat protein
MENIFQRVPSGILVFGLLLFLSTICFSNNLRGEFMIDDFDLVLGNHRGTNAVLADFARHFISKDLDSQKVERSPQSVYYRPLAHALPWLQSLVFGQNSFGYHVCNVILFSLVCFCFYVLVEELSCDRRFALLCSILFCLHPLNGLMVNYITASVYAVQLVLLSLCVLLYMRSEQSAGWIIVSLLMFALALLCHETTIMIPGYLFLISWYRKKSCWVAFKKILPFVMVAILYIAWRFYFTSIQESVFTKFAAYPDLNLINYMATVMKLLGWYGLRFITLQGMVIVWSTMIVHNFLWIWFGLAVFAVSISVYFIRRWHEDINQLFLIWFLLGLPPVLLGCMFLPQTGFMIEPHWLFFASFGLYALSGTALLAIAKSMSPVVKVCFFIGVGFVLLNASWHNNLLWKDQLSLTRHWVAVAPTNKNAAFLLGQALLQRGQEEEAKKWFLNSLMNQQGDWQNYTNLASISLGEGDENQALDYFQKALTVFPQSAVTLNNLGAYYLQKNNYNQAEQYFDQAKRFNPYQVETLLNLGLLSEMKKHWEQAWNFYMRGYELQPKDQRVLSAVLRVSLQGQGHEDMISYADNFLFWINREDFLNELGGLLALKGHTNASLEYFSKSVRLYPQNLLAYREMGKVFANAGQFARAEDIWQQGLRVNPQDEVLKGLLKELATITVLQ